MKRLLTIIALVAITQWSFAQGLSLPPSGDNQKASITQWIGPVKVTIDYSSPDVHGPNGEDRTGHIWGELVHYGFIDQGFGPSKAAPWRIGANENTTITVSHDVKINGKDLKAGTYGLFLDVEKEGNWNWIFSTNSTSWGSYYYDPKEDALRVGAKPDDAPYTEYMTFNFEERKPSSAVAVLQWEKKKIGMTIEVPNVNDLYAALMRNQLRGDIGFDHRNIMRAAQFCAYHKVNLEEALSWANDAISAPYIGKEEFETLQTKAMVLRAMNKNAEADNVMQTAVNHPSATAQDIHQYGTSLLASNKEKAMEVFKLNRQKFPNDKFTTFVGLARGYTALGDKKNAIKNWEIAIKNLPEDQKANQGYYESELKKLKG